MLTFSQIYKTDPCFYEHCEKKIKVDGKNGRNYVLLRIDVYFSQCNLPVKIDEKGYTDIYLVAENKRQGALEKILVVNLLELIHKVMMKIMKLIEYKHLLVSYNETDN